MRIGPRAAALVACALALAAAPGADAAKKRTPRAPKAPRVLVYSGTEGFRHMSIPHANEVIARLARLTRRFSAEFIDEPEQLTARRLAASDIVLWQNTTGAASPFTDEQEAAYVAWVRCGGGHMGVHASADSYKDWPEWTELTGAFFRVHPITPTSALDDQSPEHEGWGEPEASILVKDQATAITTPWRGQDAFAQHDELYAWDRDPAQTIADFRVVLAFGGFGDPVVDLLFGRQYEPEQPLAWTGSFRGHNRLYYTNLGHSVTTWDRIDHQDSLVEAVGWVAGKRPSRTCLRRAGLPTS